MESQLVTAGLNEPQAQAYIFMLEHGNVSPALLAKKLQLTRTNAYKILDRLVDLGLARRLKVKNKAVYEPDNPLSLTNLAAEQRNIATAREEAVKSVIGVLLEKYHQQSESPMVQTVTGRAAVIQAYQQQISLLEPLYFIRSRSDIPMLGFDIMHDIRVKPSHHGVERFGITPDLNTGPVNPDGDIRSNLKRTWVRQEDYSAPVEWSVSGSVLLIVLFGSEPHAITITSPLISDAFRQLWSVLDSSLRSAPYYNDLPRTKSKNEDRK